MRLEGTLDAFSLPDIFQLLSYTKKTGTLHLRRGPGGSSDHGVVHLRDGLICGARSDVRREALARRVVGAGLLDDAALETAIDRAQEESCGLGRVLVSDALVPVDALRSLSVEQSTDAVFDLMRWPDGEFAFVVDEDNPDDVGAAQAVEEVVAEARRRLEAWSASSAPEPQAVVSIAPTPPADPSLNRDEWALLALVDGRRTVADLVALAGSGEFTVVSALAALVERGLLALDAAAGQDSVRWQLIEQLEGGPPATRTATPEPAAAPEPAPEPPSRLPEPAVVAERAPVIPERPEPFIPARQPEHAEPEPAYARAGASTTASRVAAGIAAASSVGDVHGSVAMQPAAQALPAGSTAIERDPSVNKSLLLRLIAGVRGL